MSAPPDPVRPSCECTTLDVLEGTRAMAYAGHHLRIEGVAPDAMSATYRCPDTGLTWRETYAVTWYDEDRAVRLARLDEPPPSATRPALLPIADRRVRWAVAMAAATVALGAALTILL